MTEKKRNPLRPPWTSDDDPRRIEALKAQGLDENMMPPPLSEEEARAQRIIAGLEQPEAPERSSTMTFPKWLVTIAQVVAAVASVAVLALPVLAGIIAIPAWLPFLVFALGTVAALIAGLALPTPFKGKPILYGPAATAAATAAVALYQVAEPLPEGFLKSVLTVVCLLLAGAAGASLPVKAEEVKKT